MFAIAITLLVLDINVPESDFDDLWYGIAHQWPAYLGYVTSFVTIGGLWLAHHGIFRRIQYADARVTRLNLTLLMIVLVPAVPDAADVGGDPRLRRRDHRSDLLRHDAARHLRGHLGALRTRRPEPRPAAPET